MSEEYTKNISTKDENHDRNEGRDESRNKPYTKPFFQFKPLHHISCELNIRSATVLADFIEDAFEKEYDDESIWAFKCELRKMIGRHKRACALFYHDQQQRRDDHESDEKPQDRTHLRKRTRGSHAQ